MKKITYFCDSCGSEIVNFPVRISIEYMDRITQDFLVEKEEEFMQQLLNKEYCLECAKAAFDALRPLRKKEAKKEPKEEPKKEVKPRRVSYDHGKIKALRDAGWSWEKIKDEIASLDDEITPKKIQNAHRAWREAHAIPLE